MDDKASTKCAVCGWTRIEGRCACEGWHLVAQELPPEGRRVIVQLRSGRCDVSVFLYTAERAARACGGERAERSMLDARVAACRKEGGK